MKVLGIHLKPFNEGIGDPLETIQDRIQDRIKDQIKDPSVPISYSIEEEPGPSGLMISIVENSASYRTLRNLCRIFSRQLVLQEVF